MLVSLALLVRGVSSGEPNSPEQEKEEGLFDNLFTMQAKPKPPVKPWKGRTLGEALPPSPPSAPSPPPTLPPPPPPLTLP